ncbi:uncharacterized protein N0V89_004886 [Didymosphaeria variabile]|uniref:Uncharacterized protein n=1 Tax=Didymosphaeria variabile TaxID=1932322 RepID=A0A9W8XR45_9PLEO|nr:uncharacterized protein N0V89_004886 [Didymosphaeria variabile]KAJ4356849.1 hypothetical protein N0V89_004886 [Didymosphaeria variabile]
MWGNLGIFCQHAYAHSTEEGAKALPGILKGADMAVYSVFQALGLDISVRPIYDLKHNHMFDDYDPDKPDSWSDDGEVETEDEDEDNVEKSFVGNSCGEIIFTPVGYDALRQEILDEADAHWLKIKWLTKPASRDISFVHVTVSTSCPPSGLLVANARFSMEMTLALMRCTRMPL